MVGAMSRALLVVGVVSLLHAINAVVPRKGRISLLGSFFAAWLTIELALHWVVAEVIVSAVLIARGAFDDTEGMVGLALVLLSIVGLVWVGLAGRKTVVTMKGVLEELEPGDDAPTFPRSQVLFPLLAFTRRPGVERVRNIEFRQVGKKRLRLDVYKPAEPSDQLRPAILQIHGGAWVIGDKREQGIPLLNHLAANGWVGFNANYRLSPKSAFPEHLIDLKAALAWIREHGAEHGADPDFVCVTGGSAGGHLTAMMALTANDPRYQPGFEDVDTTLRAAVPFYGIYDFTNRLGTQRKEFLSRFIEPMIMKARIADEPQRFADASPIDLVRPDAPPFLVIHGSLDTLAPVEDARLFVERLRAVSHNPVLYAEMKGAQHAFDVFPSVRTAHVIEGVERFLHTVWANREETPAEVADDLAEAVTD
jgi:acetyl esterase/lipase